MTIIMEYIHYLYWLPIHDHRIHHMFDRDDIFQTISYLYGADRVNTIMSKIIPGAIRYYQY